MRPPFRPNRRLLPIIAAVGIYCAGPQAFAERADKEKPAVINADRNSNDELNQVSVYTGNVVLTKGTIILRADQLTVKQDPEGYSLGVAVATQPGKLAYFKQKRDGVDEYIEGEGETIEYDGKADRVKFIGKAEMRRLRGAQVNDETSGSIITYDNTNDQFTVDGGAVAATPSNPGGRVRATLAPRAAASASAGSASAAAAAASAPRVGGTPPARLRSATTLGQESR